MTSGVLPRTIWRTAALSGLTPAQRDTAKAQGTPISSSRNRRRPRCIGVGGDDGEGGGGEEVLGHAAPQVPDRLDRGVLLALDERLGIDAGQFAQGAQEVRRGEQADGRL